MGKGQSIQITYLTAGRMYYQQKGIISTDLPSYLSNNRGVMAHVLEQRPIFPKMKPRVMNDWEELLRAQPPVHPPMVTTWQCICEDNSRWPYSIEPPPTLIEQIHQARDAREETFQRSNTSATKDALGNPIATTTAMVAVFVACLFTLLIALVFVQSRFGGDDTPPPAAVSGVSAWL